MKDYHVTIKVQHGRLKQAMAAMDIKSVKELSERAGVCVTSIYKILSFKRQVKKYRGEWPDSIRKIAACLAVSPEELFPAHLNHEVLTNKISGYVEAAQLQGTTEHLQLNPAQEAIREEDVDELLLHIDSLPPKMAQAVTEVYLKDQTFEQAAEIMGMKRQQVHFMCMRALKRLQFRYGVNQGE